MNQDRDMSEETKSLCLVQCAKRGRERSGVEEDDLLMNSRRIVSSFLLMKLYHPNNEIMHRKLLLL